MGNPAGTMATAANRFNDRRRGCSEAPARLLALTIHENPPVSWQTSFKAVKKGNDRMSTLRTIDLGRIAVLAGLGFCAVMAITIGVN